MKALLLNSKNISYVIKESNVRNCSAVLSDQMSLPQSGHRMSSLSVRKPRPTRDTKHFLQLKQSLCHCLSSKEMYLLPPRPAKDMTVTHSKASDSNIMGNMIIVCLSVDKKIAVRLIQVLRSERPPK